jgi:Protein of unknown function (DUF2490)
MDKLRILSCVSIVLLCGAIAVRAQTTNPVPKSDVQFWNDTQLAVPLSKKVDFVIQGTLRIRSNFSQAVDGRWGAGWVFRPNKYLSFNPFYFHREARPPHGRPEVEERLTLGATVRLPLGKFTLSERNSFERRWREPQVDAWRYRNALLLEHPFKVGKNKFTFAVGDEVFYDWSLHVWARNRFAAGVSHVFNKHFTLYVYGMRQNDSHTRPGDITILGSQMRFRL